MDAQPATRARRGRRYRARRALRQAWGAGIAATAAGTIVLAGWLMHAPALTRLLPGDRPMAANAALALVFVGLALVRLASADRRGAAYAVVPLAVGVLSLLEHLAGAGPTWLDSLLVPPAGEALQGGLLGRPTADASTALALVGAALLAVRWAPLASQALAGAAALLAVAGLAGRIYGVEPDATAAIFSGMPAQTGLVLLAVAAGVALLRPDRGLGEVLTADDGAGVVARRLLGPALVLPVLTGWLVLLGHRAGLYGPAPATAILVAVLSACLTGGILAALREIRAAERGRLDAEREGHELAAREREVRARLAVQEGALRARDEFLSVAAHELRTPLAAARLQLQLARRRAGDDPVELAHRIETVDRVVGRMGRLVEDLLEVSRINAGRLAIAREVVDLAAVVREVAARHASVAARAGCAIELRADATSRGLWDRVRLEQVVTHLLANALKYGAGQPVELVVGGDAEAAVLEIRDHGIGIRTGERERIFERFERAVSTRNYGGFGLGLWITHAIVEALGGEISVDAAPGGGALFRVRLPRRLPPQQDPRGARDARPSPEPEPDARP